MIGIDLFIEKIEGQGEDAEPLSVLYSETEGLIGVFDGMGGAGSTRYQDSEGVTRTGAYIGSRMAKEIAAGFFHFEKDRLLWYGRELEHRVESFVGDLTKALKGGLITKEKEYKSGNISYRGDMLKRFPSTAALTYYWKDIQQGGDYKNLVIWAGDSRVYLLDRQGLKQLTKDELKEDNDAFSNIYKDSPVSNSISAGADFHLNHLLLSRKEPYILISATDGCFGFLESPMHFEHLLLDGLINSSNADEWKKKLGDRLGSVARDDVSMAAVTVGWNGFDELRDAFLLRYAQLEMQLVRKVNQINSSILKCKEIIAAAEEEKRSLLSQYWQTYKPEYEKYIEG
ncbi:MAG TPA: hypothetical protein VEG39_05235 [Clostridia bacterium]|nr:hypothetical protein [Clostridia bacterium]